MGYIWVQQDKGYKQNSRALFQWHYNSLMMLPTKIRNAAIQFSQYVLQ